MSMPQRSRSRMWDSVEQAGPMVQIILARRATEVDGVGFSSGLFESRFKWSLEPELEYELRSWAHFNNQTRKNPRSNAQYSVFLLWEESRSILSPAWREEIVAH